MEPTSEGAGRNLTAHGGVAPAVTYDGPGRILDVDGERFLIRRRLHVEVPYGYDYDWLTGPNPGYGFGTSGPHEQDDDQHIASIRDFVTHIDPATGFLK